AWLAAPAALEFYRSMGDGALRARNHSLAIAAADLLAKRWGTEVGAPATMLGAMAVVRLPNLRGDTAAAAQTVHDRLLQKHCIEVPVMTIGQNLWVRISAQIYNDLEDYLRLAAAIAEV